MPDVAPVLQLARELGGFGLAILLMWFGYRLVDKHGDKFWLAFDKHMGAHTDALRDIGKWHERHDAIDAERHQLTRHNISNAMTALANNLSADIAAVHEKVDAIATSTVTTQALISAGRATPLRSYSPGEQPAVKPRGGE